MSKQQGYQKLDTDVPNGQEYGFAARLPQAGGSCQAEEACHANFEASSTRDGPMMYPPPAYPPSAYEGAPVTGYPVTTTRMPMPMPMAMAGPVGMVSQDPLGRRGRRRARRMAGGRGGGRRGPVHALVGLVRSAIQSVHQSHPHPPPPQQHPGSSYQ